MGVTCNQLDVKFSRRIRFLACSFPQIKEKTVALFGLDVQTAQSATSACLAGEAIDFSQQFLPCAFGCFTAWTRTRSPLVRVSDERRVSVRGEVLRVPCLPGAQRHHTGCTLPIADPVRTAVPSAVCHITEAGKRGLQTSAHWQWETRNWRRAEEIQLWRFIARRS